MEDLFVNTSSNEKIHLLKWGSGEKILFLIHGNYTSGRIFPMYFKNFERDFTLYAPDMRGFGESSYYNRTREIETFAKDFVDVIDHLKLKDFSILGWSMGGAVAMKLASLKSDIKNLVLLSSIAADGYGSKLESAFEATKFARALFPAQMFFAEMMSPFQDVKNFMIGETDVRNLFETLLFTKKLPKEKEMKIYIEECEKQKNVMDALEAMYDFDMTSGKNSIRDINSKVYIFHGLYDNIVSMLDARKNEKLIRGAKLFEFKKSGHAIFIDEKEKFENELRRAIL